MSVADVVVPFPIVPRPIPVGDAAEPANAVRPDAPPEAAEPIALTPDDPRVVVRIGGQELVFGSEPELQDLALSFQRLQRRAAEVRAFDAAPWWARLHFTVAAHAGAIAAGMALATLAYIAWRLLP